MPEIREPEAADAAAVADVVNALGHELYGGADITEAEVGHWWEEPEVQAWVAVDDSGRVLSYADLGVRGGGTRLWIDLRRGRGGEEELLETAEARARELARPGALLRTVAASIDEPARRLYGSAGYEPVRYSFHMSIDVRGDVPAPTWPEGIRVRTFDPEADARRLYEADIEAFEDHWDFMPVTYERWRQPMERAGFDPSLWFLAEDGSEIAGYSLCAPHFSGEPGVGRVADLGVRRKWRRRGLGLALLHHSFRALEERGYHEVRLEVDGENLTGAVRLYERAGMHVVRRYDTYEKVL